MFYRRYVVTAAHCQSKNDPIVEVVLGAENLDIDPECPTCAPQQKFKITYFDVTIHENYDRKNALKIRKKL